MTRISSLAVRSTLTALAVAALVACGSAPRSNAALDEARASYQRAASDPQVVRSAELELRRAQEALQRGEAALRADEGAATVEHYAYLAKRRSEVAQQAGKIAEAEKAVKEASEKRNAIVIESRTQEAQAQRAQADAARKLAEERVAAAEAAQRQAVGAQLRAKALEDQLAELKAKQTSRGMVLTLGDVLFDTGRAELKPGAARTLDQLATFLRENPERTVQIEGYTDSVGSDLMNQSLSERRANSVKSALMDRGISITRIAARGFGEANPVATNDTAAGRQQNRRVEIVISNKT